MKTLFISTIALFLAACNAGKPELPLAQKAVENLLQKIDNADYEAASKFYTIEFNEGESIEVRSEKFKKLKETLGAAKSHELISWKNAENEGLILTYKTVNTKHNTIETFTVIKDEGEYKIARHGLKSE